MNVSPVYYTNCLRSVTQNPSSAIFCCTSAGISLNILQEKPNVSWEARISSVALAQAFGSRILQGGVRLYLPLFASWQIVCPGWGWKGGSNQTWSKDLRNITKKSLLHVSMNVISVPLCICDNSSGVARGRKMDMLVSVWVQYVHLQTIPLSTCTNVAILVHQPILSLQVKLPGQQCIRKNPTSPELNLDVPNLKGWAQSQYRRNLNSVV